MKLLAAGVIGFMGATIAMIPLSFLITTDSDGGLAAFGLVHLALWGLFSWVVGRQLTKAPASEHLMPENISEPVAAHSTSDSIDRDDESNNLLFRLTVAALVVVLAGLSLFSILGGGDASDDPGVEANSVSLPPEHTTTTGSDNSAQVEIGAPCATAGVVGQTADGSVALCSGSAADGTPLDSPAWRVSAAGDDIPLILGEREASAVALVKEMAPQLARGGDHGVLVIIEEFAATARLASAREFPVGDGFINLVDGVRDANGYSYKDSIRLIEAYLEGVIALTEPHDVASIYAARQLDWYRTGSVLTYWGLVSKSSPDRERQYIDAWSSALGFGADDPDGRLARGYEDCALGSQSSRYGEPTWWADDFRELIAEDPPSEPPDSAFGLLMATEWAVTLLCPEVADTWDETKGLLQHELWYPTLAQYPFADDIGVGGLFP